MARDKLVRCRVCGSEIAKSAKKCPQCGAKQKKSHAFRNLLLLVIIVGAGYYAYQNGMVNKVADKLPSEVASVIPTKTTEKETTAKTTETASSTQAQTNKQTEAPAADTGGVTPEFKEYMDSYESFMNDYCDFMQSYDATNPTMLAKYTSLISDYADFATKIDSYNEDNLSAEDYKYYVDVMARVEKKLIDTSVTIE